MPWTKSGSIKGPPGAAGAAGAQGPQGLKGAAGAAGSVWHIGAGVPPGPTGVDNDMYLDTTAMHIYQKTGGAWHDLGAIKGDPGAGIQIQGSQAGTAIGTGASAGLGAGDAGKAWIISAPGAGGGITWATGHMAVWDGTAWHDAGLIQGPAGPQGPPGAAGATGPTGPVAAFSAGTSLAAGAAPTITGTGTAGDPYVLSVAQGAAGAAGATGPQGNAGAAGPKGDRGSKWFTGAGAPGTVAGSAPGDMYLDLTTGDVYDLT